MLTRHQQQMMRPVYLLKEEKNQKQRESRMSWQRLEGVPPLLMSTRRHELEGASQSCQRGQDYLEVFVFFFFLPCFVVSCSLLEN